MGGTGWLDESVNTYTNTNTVGRKSELIDAGVLVLYVAAML